MPMFKYSMLFCSLVLLTSQEVQGADPRMGMPTAASRYFGGSRAMLPNQPVRRPSASPRPMEAAVTGKPHQNINREPSLSPYLALDLVNDEATGLPNYYAFYQPMRQQQQANQAQEAGIRRMQQQLRVANATGAISRNPQGGLPTTGSSSQFMNLGGYFPGLR